MRVVVAGATGLVGSVILKVLEERNFFISELIPVASQKSIGKTVVFNNKHYTVVSMEQALEKKPQLALFSAGGNTSLQWAPTFANMGCKVIDNSSAWRMHQNIKLIVPEINAYVLTSNDMIIANPNCSTIQIVVALNLLHQSFKIKRIVVSTYQSVTGTGVKAVQQLENERNGIQGEMAYTYAIDKNAIPQIDVFLENSYTKEEMKMVNETKKIFNDDTIQVSATCVRIPVVGAHSESVNVAFEKSFSIDEVYHLLNKTPGLKVVDDIKKQIYPMPITAQHKDDVFIGRVRLDETQPNTLNAWIVADNLRKGAATNAVQIAEYLISQKLI